MSLSASWGLEISSRVFRTLRRLPRKDARRILTVIYTLSVDPYAGDTVKMKGELDTWRKRVGAYRIFFKTLTHERVIVVFNLERRTSTTY